MNTSSSSIGTVLLVAGVIFLAFTSMVLVQSEMGCGIIPMKGIPYPMVQILYGDVAETKLA